MVTHREKLEHLLAGGYLVDGVGKKNLDVNGMLQWGTGLISTVIDLNASIYTEPKWYDNIPEKGILCRVDDKNSPSQIELITSYIADTDFPFIGSGKRFRNATPLTLDEVSQYILP